MHRLCALAALVGLVLLAAGCRSGEDPGETLDLLPLLAAGGWLPRSELIDLRSSARAAIDNTALWQPAPVVPGEGWEVSGSGWRPVGERASLRFWRRSAAATELLVDLRSQQLAGEATTYEIEVILNGIHLGTIVAGPGRTRGRLPLPPDALTEICDLELRFAPPVPPAPPDLAPLTLLRLGVPGSEGAAGTESTPGWQLDGEGHRLVASRSGSLVVPLELPQGADSLRLEARAEPRGPSRLRLAALDFEGNRIELGSLLLGETGWQRFEASLAELRRPQALLLLETELGAGTWRVEVREATLQIGDSPPAERSPRPLVRARERLPDVLLIVLDAARGDRFPGWQYPRRTLPTIGELAKDAVVFRHAFAECPTTSCSVPALITGVSFLPGGEVGSGRQMSEELTTLAEYLAAAGYHTVGLSATPNNSAGRNMDQGFVEFKELWGRDNPDHGPFQMSRLASERLRAQAADEPLFLQLHYLPPHQPYDPGSEFDLFTEPSYAGPIHPRMSLKPYNLGLSPLAGPDLAHLIALYDGNLLRADAAVAEVLTALRETERFDDALIVITSDHGEAFMEHGFQGHNTTLYEEMLHVPLIFRLPGGEVPSGVETEGLASLLDVVPTVLGVLGLDAVRGVDGQNLLAPLPAGASRLLYARTSHPEHPWVAARSRRFKAIAWPRHGVQLLFDLASDPGELVNLVGERPELYAGLGLMLRRHLLRAAELGPGGETVALPPDTQEALRALGYLD